ncbi:MAG: conjugal transfer protein TraF [Alphaproteobacteria bacterium]
MRRGSILSKGDRRKGLLAGMAMLLPAVGAFAQTANDERFFDRGQEGWFWYEPLPEDDEALPIPAEQPDPAPVPDEIRPIVPAEVVEPPAEAEPPKPLSAAWFRENLDGFRDRALDDPSPVNTEAYLYLQRIALERAGAFAEASAAAAARDPFLDANSERPIATYAAQAVDDRAEAARAAVLGALAKEAGILFFYDADCALCSSQAGVLDLARRLHGFEIIAVSLDGSPPPAPLTAHRQDQGQAERLGVVSLPATFLVRPTDLILPIAQAPLDLTNIGRRIIALAHDAGLISEDDYLATRAIARPFALPGDFDELPPEVMDDPAELVRLLRAQLGVHAEGGEP